MPLFSYTCLCHQAQIQKRNLRLLGFRLHLLSTYHIRERIHRPPLEYNSLKSEQAQRIGFRDNLLYVTLGVLGGIVSFSVSGTTPAHSYALLVIPWVCLILGWTYVVNDEKISAIGCYIRLKLVDKIQAHTGYADLDTLFGWEIAHRDGKHRKRRKLFQLIVDEITFVISGIIALCAFWLQSSPIPTGLIFLAALELTCLIVLGSEIIIYADLGKGR